MNCATFGAGGHRVGRMSRPASGASLGMAGGVRRPRAGRNCEALTGGSGWLRAARTVEAVR